MRLVITLCLLSFCFAQLTAPKGGAKALTKEFCPLPCCDEKAGRMLFHKYYFDPLIRPAHRVKTW